ncbi:MAG: aminotransferase class V-fold PLP-dependent enzyme [Planctomycetota bacterium]
MIDRRALLGAAAVPLACLVDPASATAFLRDVAVEPGGAPEDEDFWREIARAFAVDRSLVNLNNGGVSPSPQVVQDAYRRHLDFANSAPAYAMWRIQEAQRETVRKGLARVFGCDAEEVAITHNTSESLWTCQYGLDLQPGDEVVTSTQDYPRMLSAFRQLERRRGVKLVQVELPVPVSDPSEVVRRFAAALTERTRMMLCSHVVYLTGEVLPIAALCELGRERGVPVIVDGAHAFAHLEFDRDALGCDYYATSLHKWLFAPFGTGMLYVRRERIKALWPLTAAEETLDDDIRKFEQIGTYPVPLVLSIADALAFHAALGAKRKLARLRWLRARWIERLADQPRVRFNTHVGPDHGRASGSSFANVGIEGVDTAALQAHLWRDHRIYTIGVQREEFNGLRVTPSVYTTVEEIDRFGDVLMRVLERGLPA